MIKSLSHVCIMVKDLERAVRFYRDKMGLKCHKIIHLEGKFPQEVLGVKGVKLSYTKLTAPGISANTAAALELHCWSKPRVDKKPGYGHFSFDVEDVDSEYRRLRAKGVRFISAPMTAPDGHARVCFALDPDSNRIELIEYK